MLIKVVAPGMKYRVFIAINFPENIKNKLVSYQAKWPELPVRWIKKNNLHITLVFIGNISDQELVDICRVAKEVASRNNPFSISLKKIIYGPPKKPPRMIWAWGEASKELGLLKKDLDSALAESPFHFAPEERALSAHVTLGRLKMMEWRQVEPEERPEVAEEISFNFEVNSIEVMESRLGRGGAEYTALESAALADSKNS